LPDLSPGERSILAYFESSNDAEEAGKELINEGYEVVQLDRVSKYGVELDKERNYPVAGRAETQTGLTVYSADTYRLADTDTRILMSADPSVSGMAANNYDVAGEGPFLLTVVTHEKHVDRAVEIIKRHGGKI